MPFGSLRRILPRALALGVLLLAGCEKRERGAKSAAPRVVTTKGGVEMALLPGGWFEMGTQENEEKDEPRHKVYVSSFCMDRYEVTQEEYEKLMGKNPSQWKGRKNPVEQIRWAEAAAYCNARSRLDGLQPAYDPKSWECSFEAGGYRLPTEAEWEYACRAGTQTAYFFGEGAGELKRYAWFKDNAGRGPREAGTRPPNPWGLHDLCGNVWEWCNDFYQEGYYQESPEKDPRGPKSGKTRVLRGGCWNSRAEQCRSSYRNYEDPGYTDVCFGADVHGFVGFRCVKRQAATGTAN